MGPSTNTFGLFLLAQLVTGAKIATECKSRLPMGLSTVVSDLENDGATEIGTACVLTSRGVTQGKKIDFFGIEDKSTTSFGTDDGICVALSPSSVAEAASTAVACGGNILYCPDEQDLSRGEGLFDSLAPAMERILSAEISSGSLIVVSNDPEGTKTQLEEAAAELLSNLVSPSKKVSVLGDIFSKVDYVTSVDDALEMLEKTVEPSQAQEMIANTVASDFWQTTPASFALPMSAKDLAAARQLGPAARRALDNALETVQQMSAGQVVSNFGDLCAAASKRALEELDGTSTASILSSDVGKQLRANLEEGISAELADMGESQLELLKESCFDEFKKELSKLRISPRLADDMQDVLSKSVASFAKQSKKMPISNADAKAAYKAQLQEFCTERLLVARASGQFRPVPRKGVTIGMHWLLPKPFGNDVRQEPWMVHATDNLVYVPPDKITDVNPEEVRAGDWRNKVVPFPSGAEMLYVQ